MMILEILWFFCLLKTVFRTQRRIVALKFKWQFVFTLCFRHYSEVTGQTNVFKRTVSEYSFLLRITKGNNLVKYVTLFFFHPITKKDIKFLGCCRHKFKTNLKHNAKWQILTRKVKSYHWHCKTNDYSTLRYVWNKMYHLKLSKFLEYCQFIK